MEVNRFDTELFIEEVKSRSAIWDMECADYKNRDKKRSSWQQLVDIFSDKDSSEEQKKHFGVVLQKKWKSLRDNFAREMKKQKTLKSGAGASNHPHYAYFSRLQFLEKTISNRKTTSNLHYFEENVEVEDPVYVDEINTSRATKAAAQTKKIKLNPVEQHFTEILNKSIQLREERETEKNNEDDDKLFCLSLYKELKKVPEQGKIRTKIQLLEILQKAQEYYGSATNQDSQGVPFYTVSNLHYGQANVGAYSNQVQLQPNAQVSLGTYWNPTCQSRDQPSHQQVGSGAFFAQASRPTVQFSHSQEALETSPSTSNPILPTISPAISHTSESSCDIIDL